MSSVPEGDLMEEKQLKRIVDSHKDWFGQVSGRIIAIGSNSILTKGRTGTLFLSYYDIDEKKIHHDQLKRAGGLDG